MNSIIDGNNIKSLIEFAYKNLKKNEDIVNDLNVFPVPDGDTGANMLMTIKGGYDKIKDLESLDLVNILNLCSDGMLLSARGNSGVILSQLFYGFTKGINNKSSLTLSDLKIAFKSAVDIAYKAVENPTEGTILTVAREVYEGLNTLEDSLNLIEVSNYLLNKANESVLNTPNLLNVLKEAGVVDSGGAGLYYLFEGVNKYLKNESIDDDVQIINTINNDLDTFNFNENSHLEFGYCSEILLQLMAYKCDIDKFDLEEMRSFLNSIGDSLVLVKTGSIIKIHVHTFTPYKLLEYAQQFGEFIKVKIENMTIQHTEVVIENRFQKEIKKEEVKEYAVVSVATGDGIIDLFKELGCDYIINGGQTNNPSANDFLEAFDKVNAKNIFVLPNNSNIILTANQAAKMYDKANIIVIESKNIGDGYSILSMIDYSSNDINKIKEDMIFNMSSTKTSLITKSIRDTSLDGIDIKKDQYIGFSGKKMLSSNDKCINTLKEIIDKVDSNNEIAMLIFGKDSKEEDRLEIQKYIKDNHRNLEYYEIDGKQDIYDYYVLIQ